MYDLVSWTLQHYSAGTLIGGKSATTQTNLITYINSLYCIVGLPAPTIPLGSLGPDGAIALIPAGTTTTTNVVTDTKTAGIQVPPNTVTQPAIITVVRIQGRLLTQLDQYPLYYQFTSDQPLNTPVVVGVCIANDLTPPDPSRLRVAHNIPDPNPTTIEILPLAPAPFLDCTNATSLSLGPNPTLQQFASWGLARAGQALRSLLRPAPLSASLMATTGLGGTTKKLSPFGVVDTLITVSAMSPTSITGVAGSTVAAGSLPSVRVATPNNNPVTSYPVTFAVPAGSEGAITGGAATTDANGIARVGTWTLGADQAPDTVAATVAPPHLNSGVQGSPVRFIATVLKAVVITAPTSLSDGVQNGAYTSTTFTATGGNGTYTWAVSAGTLPAGLALSAGGVLSGTPTAAGSATFTVQATSGPSSATKDYSLTILTPASIAAPASLGDGIQNAAYASTTFTAIGGNGTFSWAVSTGALPAGLSLSDGGVLTGTPTGTGTSNFTVQVTSGPSTSTKDYALTILPPAAITGPALLSDGIQGAAYSSTSFTASGGTGSYTWAVSGGALPAGLTLSSAGILTGTPTASGNASFTVQVTSGVSTATKAYGLVILPPATVTGPASLADGAQGNLYPSTTFTAGGGTGSYSWVVSGGALPAGLSLSSSGILSGTPTVNGSFTFTAQVTSGVSTGTRDYTLKILPPVTITTTSPLPAATIGVAYSLPLQATGGTGSYGWSVTGGALPAGFTFSGAGVLSGLATAPSTSNFTTQAVSGPGSTSSSFALTASYPTALKLSFQVGPSGSACYAVNAVLSPSITVKVTDAGGNPVSGVTVSIKAVVNNGSWVAVSQPSVVTGANGLAVFNTLSINKTGGYTLQASTGSPWPGGSASSGKFNIKPSC
jgi:hypothetical protein